MQHQQKNKKIVTQNLLFYYDSDTSTRPLGLIFLEGCYCERLVAAPSYLTSTTTTGGSGAQSSSSSSKVSKEEKLQVSTQNNNTNI